jgi:predicted N-acetyltransferase YhbS
MKKDISCRRELGDGLVLKTAASEADIERVAASDTRAFDEKAIGEFCRTLFLHHPNTQPSDLIFVEDEKTGEVVSSLCLIPWEWQYEDVTLKAGEMGIVGTVEPYRRRGLIRAQAEYHNELLLDRGFDLSQIQGIPHFYRQFGYEYTLPLEGGYSIEIHQIPEPDGDGNFKCRPETEADLPVLKRLYDEASRNLAIHTSRDDAIWRYLSEHSSATITGYTGWVVEDTDKEIIGYFRIQKYGFGRSLNVYEASEMSYGAALAALRYMGKLAVEREKPNIRLILPANCVLIQVARHHGAHDLGTYAWQIHIPDMTRILRTIGPILERRLAESPFARLTEEIRINLYRDTIALHFNNGKLTKVESLGAAGGPIRIPPRAFVPLILGYRNREELRESWPDLGMPPKYAYLIDVLFPKTVSHIYAIY